MLSCEVLVVGAGVGGSVTASELHQSGFDTLLIDAGPDLHNFDFSSKQFAMQNLWKNGGLTGAMGKPNIPYAEGACLGGGSEINSGIIQRCPDHLLNHWAQHYEIKNFSADILKPYYEKSEKIVQATPLEKLTPDAFLLQKAANHLGWQGEHLALAYKGSEKQSLSKVLINPARKQGLKVLSACSLKKIIFQGKQAIKAILVQGFEDKTQTIEVAFKYLFLCTGAIQTPFILLKHGISHNVGRHLKMHPTIKVTCRFPDPINLNPPPVPAYAITEFMPRMRIGGSVFTPGYFAMTLAEDWQNRKHLLPHLFYCGIYYAMIRPEGFGRIHALPGISDPLVSYALHPKDWQNLETALSRLSEAMFAAEAIQVIPSIMGHPGWTTPPKNLPALTKKNTSLMSIHLFSSCPLGENQKICATNSYGQVHNYANVYVNDASLIPDAPGTNPQATIMAIALRNCEHFITMHPPSTGRFSYAIK